MYISNRFDLGEEVYFINNDNKPCKAKVARIHIHVLSKEETCIDYLLDIHDREMEDSYDEDELFASEYELREAWMKNLITFV